jgi:hypothetical protein
MSTIGPAESSYIIGRAENSGREKCYSTKVPEVALVDIDAGLPRARLPTGNSSPTPALRARRSRYILAMGSPGVSF